MVSQLENSDPNLKNLLTEWNLQHHYEHFIEQRLSIKVLKVLQPKHIERLFVGLPVGDFAMFEHRLEIWKRSLLLDDFNSKVTTTTTTTAIETAPTTAPASPTAKRQKLSTDMAANDSLLSNSLLEALETDDSMDSHIVETIDDAPPQTFHISTPVSRAVPATPRSVPTAVAPVLTRRTHTPSIPPPPASVAATPSVRDLLPIMPPAFRPSMVCRYDLMKILTETSGGQLVLNYYAKYQHLREEHRTALINVIARYIDANGCTLTLSESNQLETQIVELFPTEKAEFYRTARRGRLYNKVANMKRVYKKFSKDSEEQTNGPNTSQMPSPTSSSLSIKEEDEYVDVYSEDTFNDWRAKAHSTGNFVDFWKRTQIIRLKQINEIPSLQEILTLWPEYKESNIAEWVAMDFAIKYPSATKFTQVFYDSIPKLEKVLFTKVSTSSSAFKYLQLYQKSSTESQHLIILYALHQLFPPKHIMVVENGVKCKKRYSIQDSQNACINIQSSQALIDEFISTKTTATPPMLLVVGELGVEIKEISVYFEGLCYAMPSVAEAAELCCELFFLFNIDFPEESVLYYHFVQTYFLNIQPETKNSRIYTTINDINAY